MCCLFWWHRQVISYRKETSCLPLVRPGFEPRYLWNPFPGRLNARSQAYRELSNKNAPDSPYLWWLSIQPTWYIHTYICTYTDIHTCLLLLILMLWHMQAIFKSKGDELSSSAECRIRTMEVWDTKSPANRISTHKPTETSYIHYTHTH